MPEHPANWINRVRGVPTGDRIVNVDAWGDDESSQGCLPHFGLPVLTVFLCSVAILPPVHTGELWGEAHSTAFQDYMLHAIIE